MNYYIDFDSTLYDTTTLTKDMLASLAENICKNLQLNLEDVNNELKAMFNRENIYNIYKLAKFFANKYNIEEKKLVNSVENVILDGNKYVYSDTINFLKRLKEKGNIVNILTYVTQEDLSYQLSKIKGSGLSEYVDNIFIVSTHKYEIDLKYEEGIFIDDNPKDLKGLSKNNPKQLIRIRRENNKYSKEELDLENLIECKTFDEIDL
jgi:FMN phosphatase YigB (HAD superfamily)